MQNANKMSRQCEQTTKAGTRCRANAVNGSVMCWSHDPALAERQAAARRRGGEHKRRTVMGPESSAISLRSGSDAVGLAVQMIDLVLHGELDPKVANCAGCLLNTFLRALKEEDFERRIVALEAAQNIGPQRSRHRIEAAEQFGSSVKQS